jgi:hypothetical protein
MLNVSRLMKGSIAALRTGRQEVTIMDAVITENLSDDDKTNSKAAGDVVAVAHKVQQIDLAMIHIHEKFEDDADERRDYKELEKLRFSQLEFIAETPSQSRRDMVAKARLLLSSQLISDYEMHCAVANSLARDVCRSIAAVADLEDQTPQ